MTDEVFKSVMAEVAAEEAVNNPTEEVKAEDTEPEQTEAVTEEAESDDNVEKDPVIEENKLNFPKSAQNAIARQKQINGKLRAQTEAMAAELSDLREAVKRIQSVTPEPVDPNMPNEDNFDNYGDYLKASIKYELSKENNKAEQPTNQPTQEQIQEAQYVQKRVMEIENLENEFLKIAPDYKEVEADAQDIIDSASPELVKLFLEVENPPLAFYNLAKSGKLESLLDMPLNKAAIEIGKALAQGTPRRISSAPQPLSANTGTGSGIKPIENMSYTELMAALNLK